MFSVFGRRNTVNKTLRVERAALPPSTKRVASDKNSIFVNARPVGTAGTGRCTRYDIRHEISGTGMKYRIIPDGTPWLMLSIEATFSFQAAPRSPGTMLSPHP